MFCFILVILPIPGMFSDMLFVKINWFGASSMYCQFFIQEAVTSENVSTFALLHAVCYCIQAEGAVLQIRLQLKWTNALFLVTSSLYNLVTCSVSCSSSKGCNLSLWSSLQHTGCNVTGRIVPGNGSVGVFLSLVRTSAWWLQCGSCKQLIAVEGIQLGIV